MSIFNLFRIPRSVFILSGAFPLVIACDIIKSKKTNSLVAYIPDGPNDQLVNIFRFMDFGPANYTKRTLVKTNLDYILLLVSIVILNLFRTKFYAGNIGTKRIALLFNIAKKNSRAILEDGAATPVILKNGPQYINKNIAVNSFSEQLISKLLYLKGGEVYITIFPNSFSRYFIIKKHEMVQHELKRQQSSRRSNVLILSTNLVKSGALTECSYEIILSKVVEIVVSDMCADKVFIKPHPLENIQSINNIISKHTNIILLKEKFPVELTDVHEKYGISVVCGFGSTALLALSSQDPELEVINFNIQNYLTDKLIVEEYELIEECYSSTKIQTITIV